MIKRKNKNQRFRKATYNSSDMTKIIRTNRKTIAIIVEKNGSLTVRAPKNTPTAFIEQFISGHSAWIQKTRAKILQRQIPVHQYRDGEIFNFLGFGYSLKLVDGQKPALIFSNAFLLSSKHQPNAHQILKTWYQENARRVITDRVGKLSSTLGYHYSGLRITSAQTRWGSCSSRKTLSFSFRLVMAPLDVIDSVILHELVHLDIPNHSAAFYQRLEKVSPDYRNYRQWLNENGSQLNLE